MIQLVQSGIVVFDGLVVEAEQELRVTVAIHLEDDLEALPCLGEVIHLISRVGTVRDQ